MIDPNLPHRGRCRGHDVVWKPETRRWYWADTGEALDDTRIPDRACAHCGRIPVNGHDACLGYIPGVIQACCGHGKDPGYILWPGMRIHATDTNWLCGIRAIDD